MGGVVVQVPGVAEERAGLRTLGRGRSGNGSSRASSQRRPPPAQLRKRRPRGGPGCGPRRGGVAPVGRQRPAHAPRALPVDSTPHKMCFDIHHPISLETTYNIQLLLYSHRHIELTPSTVES
ncbi:uncharacterized protein LOC135086206 [Ostrinia nubilalis]|uniref:uncharacterized protein LOC135086206 n=1 Tax=Ostrinia nubilalis TaxID=29057 RepID=UPI0030825083